MRHLNERRHSEDFNTGILQSVESVRGGRHRAENRRRINAYTYALVESVREGRRKIDDGRKEKASLTQECTHPSSRHRTDNRRKRRHHSVKSALVPSKIAGGRTGVRVERGYLRSSQKGRDGTQQTGADRGCIHRRAVCHCSRQTPHRLPHTINALASISAHSAPSSLPSKHSAAGMCATPPALPPFKTLGRRCARNAPGFLPSKHSPANVRAHAQCPQLFSILSTLLPMWARRGGGGWGTQPEVVDSSINLNGHRRRNGRTDDGRRTERSEANVGGNRGVLKATIL